MASYYGSETAKCPFYQDETRNTIKCEGELSQYCVQIFKTADEKKTHKSEYCDSKYVNCVHWKRVYKKYC